MRIDDLQRLDHLSDNELLQRIRASSESAVQDVIPTVKSKLNTRQLHNFREALARNLKRGIQTARREGPILAARGSDLIRSTRPYHPALLRALGAGTGAAIATSALRGLSRD